MAIIPEVLTAPIILAAIGGLVVNVLNLLELLNLPKERRPDLHDRLYWFQFVAWPILGGVLGYLYNDAAPLGKLVAFHIGLSSPLILKTMANAAPAQARQPLPPGA